MILIMTNPGLSFAEKVRIRIAWSLFPKRILRMYKNGDVKMYLHENGEEEVLRGHRADTIDFMPELW